MGSERNDSERERKEEWIIVGRRRGSRPAQRSFDHRLGYRTAYDERVGNRGVSRHLRWRGPWEPPPSGLGPPMSGVFSLFVDGIPTVTTLTELRSLFEQEGVVSDVYISGKVRKNKDVGFGFIRFQLEENAASAIRNLDGFSLHGHKLKVTMAKFQKGGKPVTVKNAPKRTVNHRIEHPAHRDQRRYSEALEGKQSKKSTEKCHVPNEKQSQVSLRVFENPVMVDRLAFAAVVDLEPTVDIKLAATMVSGTNVPFTCLSSFSPSKMLLFFEDESGLKLAVEKTSPLRKLFIDVRRWSDMECYLERFVWLECRALNPKCWSTENFMKVGDLWVKTVKVVLEHEGINTITSVKILVKTKTQGKIETGVRIEWDSGSGVVWVKEIQGCECMGKISVENSDRH
ncbi:unnamed protein product [Amaranthus hypochondriacus]